MGICGGGFKIGLATSKQLCPPVMDLCGLRLKKVSLGEGDTLACVLSDGLNNVWHLQAGIKLMIGFVCYMRRTAGNDA